MNIPDHISECLETIFWVKKVGYLLVCGSGCGSGSGIRNLFDPGSGMEKFGFVINIGSATPTVTELNDI
jgi:hypothetical protein